MIPLKRGDKTEVVAEAYKEGLFWKLFFRLANIDNKWAETSWAKKLARRAEKAAMTDFCRFKVQYAKKH